MYQADDNYLTDFEFGLSNDSNEGKSKELRDQVELKRLRAENRLLRQRIEDLQKENVTLADRLIDAQLKHGDNEFYIRPQQISLAQHNTGHIGETNGKSSEEMSNDKFQNQPQEKKISHLEWTRTAANKILRRSVSVKNEQPHRATVQQLDNNDIYVKKIKRLNVEIDLLQEKQVDHANKELELHAAVEDFKRQLQNIQSKMKEGEMMSRIRDAEHSHQVAEMRQRIAELEIQNQELLTAQQLNEVSHTGHYDNVENRITDLKEEIIRLKLTRLNREASNSSSLKWNEEEVVSESDSDEDNYKIVINQLDNYPMDPQLLTAAGIDNDLKKPVITTWCNNTDDYGEESLQNNCCHSIDSHQGHVICTNDLRECVAAVTDTKDLLKQSLTSKEEDFT